MKGFPSLSDAEKDKLKDWYYGATGHKLSKSLHFGRYAWLYKYLKKECSKLPQCDIQAFDFQPDYLPNPRRLNSWVRSSSCRIPRRNTCA